VKGPHLVNTVDINRIYFYVVSSVIAIVEAFRSVQLKNDTENETDFKSEKSIHRDLFRAHREWSYFWFLGPGLC
jgi:hypothetical protein